MHVCMRHVVGFAALAIGSLVTSTWSAAAETRALTSVEVRDQFVQCGFEMGNPGSPSTGRFVVVRDPGANEVRDLNYRIVMAIVYPSEAAAFAEHQQAHRDAEQRTNVFRTFSNDNGPQLLAGYGGSVWRANVAMVQTSSRTLASMYSYDVQTDETQIARPELFELGFVSEYREFGVDRDFVVCLQNTVIQPVFIHGWPW